MPDDGYPDSHEELVEDALLTEALLGWDGDPCDCRLCDCLRFRDGSNSTACRDCDEGRHWPASRLGEE